MEGITLGIPFGVLLFVLAFLVYWVNAFFIIYHLTRFGIGTHPKIIALIFFIGSVVFFTGVMVAYARIDIGELLLQFNSQYLMSLPRY